MALTVQERNDTATTRLPQRGYGAWLAQIYNASDDAVLQNLDNVSRARIRELHSQRSANWIKSFMYESLDRPLLVHAEAIADQMRRQMEFSQEYSDHSQPRADALVRPARERLAQISRLDRDWDSYGAEPLSQKAITRANKLLGSVGGYFADLLGEQIRPYAVAPLASGGVQLQWRGPGGDLEVEVGREGDLGYLLVEGVEPNRTFTEADEVTSSEVLDLLAGVLLS